MSQPAKAPEPSIDEILDSIRRSIVPDDDADKPAARKPASRKQAAAAKGRRADGEPLRASADTGGRGDQRTHGPFDGPFPSKREAQLPESDPGRDGPDGDAGAPAEAATATRVTPPAETTETAESAPEAVLLSPRTSAVVDVAFNSLTHTVLSQNPRTLEDLVREMLKPMLKAWLDANLPDMVERLVRAEIERLSRRG